MSQSGAAVAEVQGQFRKTEERERPTLEVVTEEGLVKTTE
jgi:hypothetical protein